MSGSLPIRWIALFRGINVGGNNIIPMARLRELAAKLGFGNVATYIQSGNLMFDAVEVDASTIENRLAAAVENEFGFRPIILMRTVAEVSAAVQANPFAAEVIEGKQLHIYFCDGGFESYDGVAVATLLSETEKITVIGDAVYLFAPDGVGRSKLAEKLPRYLPKRHSARNLNSVSAILQLASKADAATA